MTTLSSFQDLKKIGKELEEKARAAEEERKRAQALKEKQAHDAQTFASAMSNMGVEPIRTKKRAELPHPKPAPIPRQTQAEHKAVLQASISDDVDPLTFLQSEDGRCFWRDGLPPDICKKLRRGDWTVQNHIDLHGLRVDPAREAVMQFSEGLAEIRSPLCPYRSRKGVWKRGRTLSAEGKGAPVAEAV